MAAFQRTMLASASLLLVAACATEGHKYHDLKMDFGSVQTVAVLPFNNLSRDNLAGERVREVFSGMLLATNAIYVLPSGEVTRAIARAGLASATAPTKQEVVKLAEALEVDAVITGVVREYGEVRSGVSVSSVVSVSAQMQEATTGAVVWSASTTKGGITLLERLIGGGGEPMNIMTEHAVSELLDRLFE